MQSALDATALMLSKEAQDLSAEAIAGRLEGGDGQLSTCQDPARPGRRNGRINGHDQNNNVNSTATACGVPATMFPRPPISKLSDAHHAAEPTPDRPQRQDAMTPSSNTNVTIGLAWGFQLRSPVAPFNAPAPTTSTRS
jgi:hypothetical protein